jgi:hypothetical protein
VDRVVPACKCGEAIEDLNRVELILVELPLDVLKDGPIAVLGERRANNFDEPLLNFREWLEKTSRIANGDGGLAHAN